MSSSLRDGTAVSAATGRGSIDDGGGGSAVLGGAGFHGNSSGRSGVDGSAGPPKELSVFERLQVRRGAVAAMMMPVDYTSIDT